VPKIVPEVNDQAAFRELSVRFLREAKALYGVATAEAITESLREHLGTQWAGRVTYDVLAEAFPPAPRFVIHSVADGHRIQAVKEIRSLMGNGLYEAKQLMEAGLYGQNPIVTTQEVADQSPEQMMQRAQLFEQRMNSMGCRVTRHYGA
jgi:ribosomal protein L7/L12